MTRLQALAGAIALAAAGPALAGAPNDPGVLGRLVASTVRADQDPPGETIRGLRERNGESLGQQLHRWTDVYQTGPDPENDQGKGND